MSAQDQTPIPSSSGLSAADLEALTPEERAAIEDGADEAAEQEELSRIAAAGEDDEDDDGPGVPDVQGAPAAPSEKAAKPAPAEDAPVAAADGAGPETDSPEPARKPKAPYTADLPADIEEKQAALSEKLGKLREQFKDGDLDVDEYEAQRETLVAEREAMNKAITKAEIAKEMQQQSAEQEWRAAGERAFDLAATPEGGSIDYRKDAALFADLNQFVIQLGNMPANEKRSMDWFLAEAHKRVLALHGKTPAPKAAPDAPAPDPKAVDRRSPLSAVPATLAQVPGADGPGDIGSEFADVDALDGDDLEQAIAKMSPAQRAKYEQGR